MALVKLTIITFYAIIHANKQGEMDFMLEVFSRDRNTDFEFFEFTDDEIKYKTKDVYDIDSQTKTIYRSLGNGTIILNGIPITIDIVTNTTVIEVPDSRHFKEWTHIKGFEYLQHFLDEYKKQNNKGIKVRKKLISFFKK